MLEAAGVPFETIESRLDEEAAKIGLATLRASDMALALAEMKALATSASVDDLVLGSDQLLERDDGSILGKPSSREDAKAQLLELSGRTHRLYSAAVIAEGGIPVWNAVETVELRMRVLSDEFLEAYFDAEFEAIRWSVGGYRIEGLGAQLFERIDGGHFAILGLPLLPLLFYLRRRGVLQS